MISSEDINYTLDDGGVSLSLVGRSPRLFRIVSGTNPYAATAVYLDETDGTRNDDGTADVTAAMKYLWETNGSTTVPADTIVEATPNQYGTGFYFTSPSASSASRYPLNAACPAFGPGGGMTGTYQIWYDPETGEAECVFTPLCEDCTSEGTETPGVGGAPPAGTGIVTVDGGLWGTPGPLTGDVTTVADGLATTIANDAVTLAKMADVATATVFYRKTAGTGDPEVQPLATLKTDLGLTGTNSGDQTITLTGDVTGSGTGTFAATIANDAVTNAKLRNSAALSVIGRSANSAGDPADIAGATVGHVLQVLAGPTVGFGVVSLGVTVVTGSSTTLSTTSGTYVDVTGWTFTASVAGNYVFIATGNGVVAATNAGASVKVRFLKDGATFTGSTWPDMTAPTGSTIYQEIGTQAMTTSMTAGQTVKGQAAYTYTGTAQNYNLNDPTMLVLRVG